MMNKFVGTRQTPLRHDMQFGQTFLRYVMRFSHFFFFFFFVSNSEAATRLREHGLVMCG
jgi:hypothetical protein